jgi:hypothetical protein
MHGSPAFSKRLNSFSPHLPIPRAEFLVSVERLSFLSMTCLSWSKNEPPECTVQQPSSVCRKKSRLEYDSQRPGLQG